VVILAALAQPCAAQYLPNVSGTTRSPVDIPQTNLTPISPPAYSPPTGYTAPPPATFSAPPRPLRLQLRHLRSRLRHRPTHRHRILHRSTRAQRVQRRRRRRSVLRFLILTQPARIQERLLLRFQALLPSLRRSSRVGCLVQAATRILGCSAGCSMPRQPAGRRRLEQAILVSTHRPMVHRIRHPHFLPRLIPQGVRIHCFPADCSAAVHSPVHRVVPTIRIACFKAHDCVMHGSVMARAAMRWR
jgi:hypothetical protein